MPIPESFQQVFELLERGTHQEKLAWHESAEPEEFFISVDRYSVKLGPHKSAAEGERHWPIRLTVLDDTAEEVDHFMLWEDDRDFARLFELYRDARRLGRNADQRLAELATSLLKRLEAREEPQP